jgi:hypothetical protein
MFVKTEDIARVTEVPACLHSCLPACLPTFLLACIPACPPACYPATLGKRSVIVDHTKYIFEQLYESAYLPARYQSCNCFQTPASVRLSHTKYVWVLNFRVCLPAGCPPTIMQPFPSASERHIKSNKIYF